MAADRKKKIMYESIKTDADRSLQDMTMEEREKFEFKCRGGVVPKTNRRRPDNDIQTAAPGDNAAMLYKNLAVWNLPPIDRQDPVQVENRITEYFEICLKNDMKPSVAGLAMALKCDRTTFWKIAHGADGYDRRYPAEVRSLARQAYQMLSVMTEDWLLNGKVNPAAGIFYAKNLGMGYKDISDLVVQGSSAPETYNADDIAKRYT